MQEMEVGLWCLLGFDRESKTSWLLWMLAGLRVTLIFGWNNLDHARGGMIMKLGFGIAKWGFNILSKLGFWDWHAKLGFDQW